jgi:hypothetical protein
MLPNERMHLPMVLLALCYSHKCPASGEWVWQVRTIALRTYDSLTLSACRNMYVRTTGQMKVTSTRGANKYQQPAQTPLPLLRSYCRAFARNLIARSQGAAARTLIVFESGIRRFIGGSDMATGYLMLLKSSRSVGGQATLS